MKRLLFAFVLCLCLTIAKGQEFSVLSAGQGYNGEYLVTVQVSTKKKPAKEVENLVMECAVRGVMFRGVASYKDYPGHNPLITDPSAERVKEREMQAFWNEKLYLNYAVIEPQSLSVMKNKQTKMYETTARLSINKESLIKWLETNGIIQGFSNLW